MAADTSAKIIDGKSVAKKIRDEITAEISRIKDATGVVPGIAVILVGDRKDSATYVRNKKKACESVGINSYEVCLPEDSSKQRKYLSISQASMMILQYMAFLFSYLCPLYVCF